MAERTASEGFYEVLWDCDHCGAEALAEGRRAEGFGQRHDGGMASKRTTG
jgi:hypothetical protein